MSQEERQSLLHTGKSEVSLRRTIGLKKDEYTLDRKSVTKSEVMNLLTSAGFSKSNPYYIVPQGRITWLTNSKDNERLELLKEVAGTAVYEDHRKESIKLIEETDIKRSKIDEMLQFIEERISELEEEKEDFNQYIQLDKTKRSCEYISFQRQLDKSETEMEQLDEKYSKDKGNIEMLQKGFEEATNELSQLEVENSRLNSILIEFEDQKKILIEEQNILLKEKALYDFKEKEKMSSSSVRDKLSTEHAQLITKLELKSKELQERVAPLYENKLEIENKLREALAFLEVERDQMAAMKSRNKSFKNEKERDVWLRKEIEETSLQILNESQAQQKLQHFISENDEILINLSREITDLNLKSVESLEKSSNRLSIDSLADKRNHLNEMRKESWRQETILQTEITKTKNEILKFEKNLSILGDKNILSAMLAVESITKELKIEDKVYGPIFELFTTDPIYCNAVDAIAGSSIFNVVVDTDETAKNILQILQHRKLGRVTFIPLNRMYPKEISFPSENVVSKNEGFSMLSVLKYDAKFDVAFKEIFSKAFICATLEIASKISKGFNLNTVTLEGDKIDKRGALTGGFNCSKSLESGNRLHNLMKMKYLQLELQRFQLAAKERTIQIHRYDQQINEILSEIFHEESNHKKMIANLDNIKAEIFSKQQIMKRISNDLEENSKRMHNCSISISSLNIQLRSLNAELLSPFSSSDTTFDEKLFTSLQQKIDSTYKELSKILKEKNNLECLKNAIKIEIESHLKRRIAEIESIWIHEKELNDHSSNGLLCSSEAYDMKFQSIEKNLDKLSKQIDATFKQIKENTTAIESIRSKIEDFSNNLIKSQSYSSSFASFKAVLAHRKEEITAHIKELGIIPSEAFQTFKKMSDQKIAEKLQKTNEQLKKFSHINKKAAEQYQSFTNQKNSLLERKEELFQSAQAIKNFIYTLDQQKDNTILNTFDQVSLNFTEIFKKVVPQGKGSLDLLREESDNEEGKVLLKGIQIKVSFNSDLDEGTLMSQLSGGQKSVVALVLIFAIQKVDPAPFYLFDEIDANLDSVYRSSVSSIINELSRDAQYITTTFRPELLGRADKFYGVQFVNRLSHINSITKDVAMEFIEKELTLKN